MQGIRYAVWGWIAGAAVACSSNGSVNIGDDNTNVPAWARGLGGTYSTDPIRPPPVDSSLLQAGTVPPGCEQRQEPFNPTITYRGYVQGFQVGNGWPSEVMILQFTELTASAVSGRVLSDQPGPGNYAAPDPNSPPMAPCSFYGAEGFQYSMFEASLVGSRLRFGINTAEPMCAWCGQQTPILWPDFGEYHCAPNGPGQQVPGGYAIQPLGSEEWQRWDAGAVCVCRFLGFCTCTADGCTTAAAGGLEFDLVMDGDQLTGPVGNLGNVILTREPS